MSDNIDWNKKHIMKIGKEKFEDDDENKIDTKKLRDQIEPWLTAVFQSDHLSLLIGTGLTRSVSSIAGVDSPSMDRIEFDGEFKEKIKESAEEQADNMIRGKANFEDDLRVAIELYKGLLIQNSEQASVLKDEINIKFLEFIRQILKTENEFISKKDSEEYRQALYYIKSFLISFASRTPTRERLNIITTNYDRFIEFACDNAGILIIDNFTGKINPILRTNKILLDYHYNPPGIRGEPRYVEGVIRYNKIHGSLDWKFDSNQITNSFLVFGADENHPSIPQDPFDHVVIYPNPSKNIETAYFPYAELFRDFSSAVCQPNSALVTYGYGFGDSHINRIIEDMLTIPSSHLVIISWDDAGGRIKNFVEKINLSQLTILMGNHFGNLEKLVNHYLPKAAIDKLTDRMFEYLEKRGLIRNVKEKDQEKNEDIDKRDIEKNDGF